MPIDIEIARIMTAGAILEDIPPPDIRRMRDAHVVGNHVRDDSHVSAPQRFGKTQKGRLVPDLRIKPRMVRDIISMRASRPRHQEWRRIYVGDPEIVEIVHQLRGLLKRK